MRIGKKKYSRTPRTAIYKVAQDLVEQEVRHSRKIRKSVDYVVILKNCRRAIEFLKYNVEDVTIADEIAYIEEVLPEVISKAAIRRI